MATTFNNIKAAWIAARKAKEPTAAFYGTLVSEMNSRAKESQADAPTEDQVIAVLKKFKKGIDEVLATGANEQAQAELAIVESYLPSVMSEDDLAEILSAAGPFDNMGAGMKWLKENHGATVDMKMASKMLKDMV